MKRSELDIAVAESAGVNGDVAKLVLDHLDRVLVAAAADGTTVSWPGILSLDVVTRAARSGRNPQTGKPSRSRPAPGPAPAGGSAEEGCSGAVNTTIGFDQAAGDFDRLAPLLWRPLAEATLKRSQPVPGERVLDACCGTGASALPTARLVGDEGRVDAVDISGEMIAVRQPQAAQLPQLRPHQCDVTRWEERDYDLIQSVMGIFFLPDMTASVRALAARCRPGGRAAFTIWRRGAVVAAGQALGAALARCNADQHQNPAPGRSSTS